MKESNFFKADNPDLNAIWNWKVKAIHKSNKVGKINEGYLSTRSKLFFVEDSSG